jgi:hypothetical protein
VGKRVKRRSAWVATAALIACALPATGAAAATQRVTVPAAKDRDCHTRLLDGRGVAHRTFTAPATGVASAALSARSGDWDLGIFDRKGRSVAGSAHFGGQELAEGIASEGERLTVQACRRSGKADAAKLRLGGYPLPKATGADRVQLVRVSTPTPADKDRLVATGLDLTEHGGIDYVDVVLHGSDDVDRLARAGFTHRVIIPDLVAHDREALRQSRSENRQSGPGVPSGRTEYRRLPDYPAEMKALAEAHPDLVEPITLPNPSHEGRPIEGLEITKNPEAADGKPVFLQMGLHHAREWPSGEHAMEWAYELVENYGSDERTTRLVDNTRTIVVPVVNPDGFNLTREVPLGNETLDPVASEVPVDSGQPVVDPGFAYKRKNCRMIQLNSAGSGYEPASGACGETANRSLGVDPNRNYGGLWGGPGASPDPTNDTFWGPGPFSEPETQNVKWLVSQNQVTTLISNHSYSDLILRPPGIRAQGDTVDEEAYRAFGQAMADKNGYSNWQSHQLYDTTGTTEDWSYYATAGFGFTFEIGRAAQSLTNDVGTGEPTSDLVIDIAGSYAGVGFHPPYPLGVIGEWNGKGPHAGQGNREAYYVALEATLDRSKHSVITGRAKPGTRLTLSKEFQTATSPQSPDESGLPSYDPAGEPRLFTDRLETKMTVGESGEFDWHVNPSTRPNVLRGLPGREATGPTSANRTFAHDPNAPFEPGLGAPLPTSYEERDFTIAPNEDNGRLDLHVEWPAGTTELGPDDLDLRLYRKNDAGLYEEVASSTNSGGPEDLTLIDPPPGDYRFRVENWYATNEEAKNWTASLTFSPPTAPTLGTRESWTLTCDPPNGKPSSTAVTVDRGQIVTAAVPGCLRADGGVDDGSVKPAPPGLDGGAAGSACKRGDRERDVLKGGRQNDCLKGRGGRDKLSGRGGDDRLSGGPGDDRLSGGPGADVLNCGGGRDVARADDADKVRGCEQVG